MYGSTQVIYTVLAFLVISTFSGTLILVSGDAGNTWGYQDGIPPALWPTEYRTCGGTMQSPIDIRTNQVVVDPNLPPFNFRDLENISNIRMTLKNNGHTAEVDIEGQNTLMISGGGLPGQYVVKQFHFHWGSVDRRGCEHDINGRRFPMEMHVVTYSSRYRMFEEAKNATGGLAVLSFLFDIGAENHAFDEIIGHLDNVAHKDDHVNIQSFSLTSLFPRSTDVYYRYYGGLTTPPCYESVIWTIFQEHIKISERQINVFRHLGDRHFNRYREISDNFRPTQPLNGRRVYTNSVIGLRYTRQGQFPGGGHGIGGKIIGGKVIGGKIIGGKIVGHKVGRTMVKQPWGFMKKGRYTPKGGLSKYRKSKQILYNKYPVKGRKQRKSYKMYKPKRTYYKKRRPFYKKIGRNY